MYQILPTEKVCGYLRKNRKSNLFFVYLNQICFGVRLFWKQSEDLRIINLLGNKSQSIKNTPDRKICPLERWPTKANEVPSPHKV